MTELMRQVLGRMRFLYQCQTSTQYVKKFSQSRFMTYYVAVSRLGINCFACSLLAIWWSANRAAANFPPNVLANIKLQDIMNGISTD
jgi:hypothetical protein